MKRKGKVLTVVEAGRKGGIKVRERYGIGFFSKIGHKGGQKIKKLVEAGKQ